MTVASNKRLTERAEELLAHVGDDLDDIHREMLVIQDELRVLAEREQDAMWAGDPLKANGIKYKRMLTNKMRIILKIRKRKVKGETA